MGTALNYPTEKQTSVATELRFSLLSKGSRVPTTFTITTATAGTSVTDIVTATTPVAVGDTTITVAALSGNIPEKAKVTFNNGVVVRLTAAASASATSLTVEPVQAFDRSITSGTAIPVGTGGRYDAGTVAQNTQFLSVVATPVALWVGEILNFGGVEVQITDDAPAGVTTLDILPLSAAITPPETASTTASFYIAGATDASPNSNPKLVDATNFTSGAGNEQIITGTNRTVNFTFQNIIGDPGAEMLKQILYNDDIYDREIYVIIKRASGETYEGACIPTSGDQSSPVQDLVTINAALQFQGASFRYTQDPNAPDVLPG